MLYFHISNLRLLKVFFATKSQKRQIPPKLKYSLEALVDFSDLEIWWHSYLLFSGDLIYLNMTPNLFSLLKYSFNGLKIR